MSAFSQIRVEVERRGFATCRAVVSFGDVDGLLAAIQRLRDRSGVRKRSGVFAIRNLLEESSTIRGLAESDALRVLAETVLGPECYPVRGILFDKVPDANWKVPWHQDVTIAVQNRVDVEGFGPWSIKTEVLHVQPPAAVLQRMLSLRLHLDPCDGATGALRVVPGSHKFGRIAEDEIVAIRGINPEHICEAGIGDVLLMRPLLLHASSPSLQPNHRRVVHLDYAAVQLPDGMGWFSALKPSA